MDMSPPPAHVAPAEVRPSRLRVAQAEDQSDEPAEPTPVQVDVSKYIPSNAVSVTMIVTVTPPTGAAFIYAPGDEAQGTWFRGPRSMGEVRLDGRFLNVKLYDATRFDIQYTNYRQP
jgi:hypothetical protein